MTTTVHINAYRLARKLIPGDSIDLYRTTARFAMPRPDVDRSRREHAVVTAVTTDGDTTRLLFANYRPAYVLADDSIYVTGRRRVS